LPETPWDDLDAETGKLSGPAGEFNVRLEGEPACSEACPAGIDVKSYVNLIADKRYEEAVNVVRRANPFPGVCGRVCTHPCEGACQRGEVDDPVAIRALKRFASDYALARRPAVCQPIHPVFDSRVAVVGGGPAGLTAASDLVHAGVPVTVFESGSEAGGILAWGIPEFRLPKKIVRGEVLDLVQMGVDIRTETTIQNPARLLDEGYSVVILATGSMSSTPLRIDGEDAVGVLDCLDFLRDVSAGKLHELPGRAVVVGGGSAAMDSARTARRLGSAVTVAYRRTEAEMPADPMEVEDAKEEGVAMEFLALPNEVLVENGKVKGLRCQRAELGEPDDSGRRRPVPVEGQFFEIEADWLIRAAGSRPDPAPFDGDGLEFHDWGGMKTEGNGRTSVPGIFAAGDLALGASSVVEAIGTGHQAAKGVLEYLGIIEPSEKLATPPMLVVEPGAPAELRRVQEPKLPAEQRYTAFDEVETGWDEAAALAEASRCRRCGACDACDVCLGVCEHKQAVLTDTSSGESILVKVPASLSRQLVNDKNSRKGWQLNGSAATLEPLAASVNAELCIACGSCEDACAYKAIRTVFRKGQLPFAEVNHDMCRACGACAGVCPTGAVQQGYVDDAHLLRRVRAAAAGSDDGIVQFSCLWREPRLGTSAKPGEVLVPCTRRLSPGLLLEALAAGASGVAVLACGDEACHYLPGPWSGTDAVVGTWCVLDIVGMDTSRIGYFEDDGMLEKKLAAFKERIAQLPGLQDTSANLPTLRSSLGRGLEAVHALLAQPDNVEPKPSAGYVLAPGCIEVTDSLLSAYGQLDSSPLMASVAKLLTIIGEDHFTLPSLLGPGGNLEEWGLAELYEAHVKRTVEAVRSSGAKGMLVLAPEAHAAFAGGYADAHGGWGCAVISFPRFLADNISNLEFDGTGAKVAFHPACSGNDQFSSDVRTLLEAIPGVQVTEVGQGCGESGLLGLDSESIGRALALLRDAEDAGANTLVTASPRCLVQLRAAQRGWRQSRVEVTDVYTFILSRSKEAME